MLTTKKPDAMGANESGCSLHEPTQPRPLPGGEQAFLRALSVPLLGGVRGGFMVPMRDGMAVAAFHEPRHWSAAVCAAPAAARREHPERCGWVFDHSRAPRDPPRFMVPMHAKKNRKGALHEPPGEGTGPTGCRPGPLTRRLEWFMVPIHAHGRNGATHQRPFSGAGVPPATGASRPRIRRGRDARDGSRDGCPTTARGEFMVLGAPFAGFLSIELAVAMAILAATLIPMSYAFLHERQLSRACYYRAVAMEIVDGEIELLRAGEWRAFAEGSNSYSTRAES